MDSGENQGEEQFLNLKKIVWVVPGPRPPLIGVRKVDLGLARSAGWPTGQIGLKDKNFSYLEAGLQTDTC